MTFRDVPPRPSAMLESLRGLGYTAASAIADIIDNSIAASAKAVDVLFAFDGARSSVSILDDGVGMSDSELELAMRLGDRSPSETRKASDLGRFGLGLKTASFSQCRRLTVASKKAGSTSILRWDLDLLTDPNQSAWRLFEGFSPGSEALLQPLMNAVCGTLVVWENLDRLLPSDSGEQELLDVIDVVEHHLGMVFHRYLAARRIQIRINGHPVNTWDPFMTSNSATWSSPEVVLAGGGGRVTLRGHVLPHKDRLSAKEAEMGAGTRGWAGQQGFYVYRNERLLVAGGWLGLGKGRAWTKDEAHRLARIRIDISNDDDASWKIDIRKSVASPPASLRAGIVRLADDVRSRARKVFAHRGRPAPRAPGQLVQEAWRTEQFAGGTRYRVDRTHPAVALVLSEGDRSDAAIAGMLRLLEETIPVQRIWLDTAEAKETPRVGFSGANEDVLPVLRSLFRNYVLRKNYSPSEAKLRLSQTEPFNNFPDLVDGLPDELIKE